MNSRMLKLLIIDDDDGDRKNILRALKRAGLDCACAEASTLEEAVAVFEMERFDCVILDYHLPGADGLRGIAAMLERDPFLPVIMSTGQGSEKVASEAIKLGAMDYISKADVNEATIRPAVENVIERARLNRKLSEQQMALTVFARVLVHDMKAPSQSISGFARLMETFLTQEVLDREKLIHQAKRIADGAERMNALLDKLHAYTEADARPHMEDFALNVVLGDVINNLDQVIRESHARVTYQNLPDVHADPTQISQLLQNLIANGIKYCRARQPEVTVDAQIQPGGECRVEVRDNGIGIPSEFSRTIFEPFKRLHARGEYEGTGLGLATCKKIVDRHGGAIWCQSELGRGTSFFFTLPAAVSSPKAVANG